MNQSFKRTSRQAEATKILAGYDECALLGGARSGKTFIIIRSILIRAIKTKSRHLLARFRFNHIKTSVWYDTLPKVLDICFHDLEVKFNKSDWFITLPNGSELWFAGVDDKERVEKILGNEYSTIYLNECSQISYESVTLLMTRLAENSGLSLRMWYDFNPPSRKHWTYLYFIDGINPATLKPIPEKIPHLLMNPIHNTDNLPEKYIKKLELLPKKQRDRFLEGKFTLDTEGALWDYELIIEAQSKSFNLPTRTVVAIDPAVTNNPDSDDTGIVVASSCRGHKSDENDNTMDDYIVHADYTCQESTQTWATAAINAYNKHNADVIVAETNQGGDLVENVLRLNGFTGRFIRVHAKKGKALRAEPVVALYEQGRISHEDGLDDLESEMMDWQPMFTKDSPNRIDAMVYAITELSGGVDFSELLSIAIGANQ